MSKNEHRTPTLKHAIHGEVPAANRSSTTDERSKVKRQAGRLHRKSALSFNALTFSSLNSSAEEEPAIEDIRRSDRLVIGFLEKCRDWEHGEDRSQ